MDWLTALQHLRIHHQPGVLVTVASARGHTPREAGAKMVVGAKETWDSIGGGNLEATAISHARQMLAAGTTGPQMVQMPLNEHVLTMHGRQCCGGEVSILLEPVAAPSAIAVFGIGHVGYELARILSRLPLALHLADTRDGFLTEARLGDVLTGTAQVHTHGGPAPETVLADLPAGAHVVIMTHDHAEDLVLCEAALRREDLGTIGLIGSSAKWARFRKRLAEAGHGAGVIDRITCPVGLPGIGGKNPAVIALSVAADLVGALGLSEQPRGPREASDPDRERRGEPDAGAPAAAPGGNQPRSAPANLPQHADGPKERP
ncbi:MAG TPA: xanthine dehydrogenase accessory protein XdhC [Beutenbergiaceae bacterium]|nr:xanthine dehydrogenase accessory protein XdhC [Beutenbergiaceae bacterium]